jgi:aryl-alcohol dehydrogenase-like predicted oxidoreductase
MLQKILLGTANFVHPYGVLSDGKSLSSETVSEILSHAKDQSLSGLDTALGYGNLTEVVPYQDLQDLRIITKISVIDDVHEAIKKLSATQIPYYGILIHDPQNLTEVSGGQIQELMTGIKGAFPQAKLGISIYDPQELYAFAAHFMPDLIQVPLNPFNQTCNTDEFVGFIRSNNIEVHARSLFLQGVLLADDLPAGLEPLKSYWLALREKTQGNTLSSLLSWAMAQDFVSAWVLGVSSVQDLEQIIEALHARPSVPDFQPVDHPLTNPKNWTFLS